MKGGRHTTERSRVAVRLHVKIRSCRTGIVINTRHLGKVAGVRLKKDGFSADQGCETAWGRICRSIYPKTCRELGAVYGEKVSNPQRPIDI